MAGGSPGPRELTLRGRRDERAVLDGLLDGARAGHSGVLVLRGEAGVGKTALLEHAIGLGVGHDAAARGRASSPRWSSPFAALHQLCAPLHERSIGSRVRSAMPWRPRSG